MAESADRSGTSPQRKRSVVVTGASDRIGAKISAHFAAMSYKVWVHFFQDETGADRVVRAIQSAGGEACAYRSDLRDEAQVVELFNTIGAESDVVGLVHCAAVFEPSKLDELTTERWDELFSVNLRSAWLCGQEAGRQMRGHGLPSWMIFFSDSGVYQDWTTYGGYVLSKQGISGLTRLLAKTFAPQIRVNAVAPGLILNADDDDGRWEKLAQRTLLKRTGSVDDLVGAVDYLAHAPYVTGVELPVDGGYRFRE